MIKNYLKFNILLLIIGFFQITAQVAVPCINPNQNTGKCVSIYYCSSLKRTLQKEPLLDEDRQFLVESQCSEGVGPTPRVCCTNDDGFTTKTTQRPTTTTTTTTKSNEKDASILPRLSDCGFAHLEQKIYNGNDTEVDEFPWMVLLEYNQRGSIVQKCAGSIINSKYILTAAHCITGRIIKEIGPLVSVRLGEYDLSSNIDCDDAVPPICNTPPVIAPVDEIIPHEGYDETTSHKYHDIGLIRLKDHITYTQFISPVCLPSADASNFLRSAPGKNLTVAGWGRTPTRSRSEIKQKLDVPVADQDKCREKFLTKRVNVGDGQLCAGGIFYQDSCQGDSGGPLMKLHKNRYFIEGVVSFGNGCGLEDWPAIYTRVSSYEDWMKSKMRP